MLSHLALVAATFQSFACLVVSQSAAPPLNLTAISAVNRISTIQCWQLSSPVIRSDQQGSEGIIETSLGDLDSALWGFSPPDRSLGSHNASAVEFNLVLSGTLLINISETGQSAAIYGGAHGLIIVADTADVSNTGHIASIAAGSSSVFMMMPTAGGIAPNHTILHDGQCLDNEMVEMVKMSSAA